MNRILKTDGLLARQKAITGKKTFVSAIWTHISQGVLLLFLAVSVSTVLISCDKKTKGQTAQTETDSTEIALDSLYKPKVNIQVNRHYDEKGNMIGFDSTYSSFYSNVGRDTAQMDSLMHSFDRFFERNHSSFLDRQFEPLFFDDSLRYPDFFHRDFFMKRYELNDRYLRESMKKMDSIKNKYFFEHSRKKDSEDL